VGTPSTAARTPKLTTTPSFSGEISASKCNVAGLVMCAPKDTNTDEYVVVSPRNTDGTGTAPGARKRFYVVITP
jgi:hypothetical protein